MAPKAVLRRLATRPSRSCWLVTGWCSNKTDLTAGFDHRRSPRQLAPFSRSLMDWRHLFRWLWLPWVAVTPTSSLHPIWRNRHSIASMFFSNPRWPAVRGGMPPGHDSRNREVIHHQARPCIEEPLLRLTAKEGTAAVSNAHHRLFYNHRQESKHGQGRRGIPPAPNGITGEVQASLSLVAAACAVGSTVRVAISFDWRRLTSGR